MGAIAIKELLEAGVHFGHQTGRWNPKMKPYIFGQRNGVHIIDLQKTLRLFKEAADFLTDLGGRGKTILFVGTKSQAQETIEEEAVRCGMYFVTNRWLGGLLTNFATVKNSIKRYQELDTMRDDGFYDKLSKKEAARLERERKKLEKNLRGIRNMERCPDALFVIDSNEELIAVREAAKLGIPIVGVVDTNSDPDLIDYVIPGNDDALRAVKLFAGTVADAILAGRSVYEARVEAELREAREKAAKETAQREAARRAKEAAKKAAEATAEAQAKAVEADAPEPATAKAVSEAESPAEGQTTAPVGSEEEAAPPKAVEESGEGPTQAEAKVVQQKEVIETASAEEAEAKAPDSEGQEKAPVKKTAAKKTKVTKRKTTAKKKSVATKKSSGVSKKSTKKSTKKTAADS